MFHVFCKCGPVLISCITDVARVQLADAVVDLESNTTEPSLMLTERAGGELKLYFLITRDRQSPSPAGGGKPKISLPQLEGTLLAFAATIQQMYGSAVWPRKAMLTPSGLRELHENYEVGP